MSQNTTDTISSGEIAEFSIPQWFDTFFLEKHLQNFYKNKEIQVLTFEVKPAVGKCENYSGCIYRVNVTFTEVPCSSTGNDKLNQDDVSEKRNNIEKKLSEEMFFFFVFEMKFQILDIKGQPNCETIVCRCMVGESMRPIRCFQ